MLQAAIFQDQSEALKLPIRLRYLRIDPEHHSEYAKEADADRLIKCISMPNTHGFIAGGIELRDLVAISTPRRLNPAQNQPTVEHMEFVPFFQENCLEKLLPNFKENCEEYLGFLNEFLKTKGRKNLKFI